MKKLKILLLLSIFTIIRVIYITQNNIYKSKYDLNTKEIIGIINTYKIDGNHLKIELKAKEKIIVNYYFKTEEELNKFNLQLGDKIKVEGDIKVPDTNRNFNGFNYNKYLKSKKIYYIFNASKITKLNNCKNYYKLKNKIINRINKINNNYLYTFILGDSSILDSNILNTYRSNGISHLFAVSGMHITLLTTILYKLLSKKIKNKYFLNSIIFLFLFFYMFLTNFTPSVIRASFLFILLSFNKLFKIKIKPLECIILILNIMLLYNPFYIYNIGFILSFLVSITLIIYSKIINNYHNYLVSIFMTSLISFLISIPVMIINYNSINLLSPLINIIFVPFISFIIFPLSLIVFFIPLFNPILLFFIKIEENLSLLFNDFSITLILKSTNIIIIILYFIIIIYILEKLKKKKYHYLIIILIILIVHSNINYLNKYPIITIIDVGQGDSILLEFPNNKSNILIDTGGIVSYSEDWSRKKEEYSIIKNITIPYLKSRGIKKIHYLILTHGDYDHMGESINLVNNFKVGNVIFNSNIYNDLEKQLIDVLDKKKIKYYKDLNELNIDKYKLYFLNTGIYDNENDNSNVIYLELNNYKFLFMGDAGIDREKDILDKYNLTNIDFLKVGHHGSNTSSSEEFINKINPKNSFISVGENNKYGHPKEEVLDILSNSKIYRTDINGGIEIKLHKNGYKINICNS